MPLLRACEHGHYEPGKCPHCNDPRREYKRLKRRQKTEPWIHLYQERAWKTARNHVRDRDQHRCRILENGRRCPATTNLDVHHLIPLHRLWLQSTSYAEFVTRATNPNDLLLVCRTHHLQLDAAQTHRHLLGHRFDALQHELERRKATNRAKRAQARANAQMRRAKSAEWKRRQRDAGARLRTRRVMQAISTAARLQQRAERDAQISELRAQGHGYKRIAATLGITRDDARNGVRRLQGGVS